MNKQNLAVPRLLRELRRNEMNYSFLIRTDGTVVSAGFCISTKEVLPEVDREYCYFFPISTSGVSDLDDNKLMRIKLR